MAASPKGRFVYVANANSDNVSVIDTAKDDVVQVLRTRPDEFQLFGSGPNALAFAADGQTMYVSNGTNNSIAVISFKSTQSTVLGHIPVGWFPAGLAVGSRRGEPRRPCQGDGANESRKCRPMSSSGQASMK